LGLEYYMQLGYHPAAVREYLMTILNSNFEEWRIQNPDSDINDFPFSLNKMSNSGALFDLDKLNDVSKNVLAKIPAEEIYEFLLKWAKEYKKRLLICLEEHKDSVIKTFVCGQKF